MMKKMINIHEFYKEFCEIYDFLYDNYDNVVGFKEAMEYGDKFIAEHKDFVAKFELYIADVLLSDRDIAAFGFTLEKFGM